VLQRDRAFAPPANGARPEATGAGAGSGIFAPA
jgi:hypothetical protein